jgi:hypothetical protein
MAGPRSLVFAVSVLALSLAATAARANGLSVSTITPIELGTVIAAPTGATVFSIDESTGTVTRISGSGVRTTSGSTRSLVTIACGTDSTCGNDKVYVRVGSVGVNVNRGGDLTNFTMAMHSGKKSSGPSGSNPVSFVLDPIGKNDTASFYVGMDFPITGDDSGKSSGVSASSFYVYVGFSNPPSSGSFGGVADAVVYRPLSLSESGALNFGKVIRPASGTGNVAVDADQGAYHLTGIGVVPSSVPSRLVYNVAGEGARSISISIPATFALARTGGGASLTVTTSSNAGGAATLSGSSGSAGTYSFGVGGSINVSNTTALGVYTGTVAISVAYN